MRSKILLQFLLFIGAAFYLFEAVLHGFGLPILEHDKIFLPTHDRYIALFALTYAALLVVIATDVIKYKMLFAVTMVGILLSMGNAAWIAAQGGYEAFAVVRLDRDVTAIGVGAAVWLLATIASAFAIFGVFRHTDRT